MEPAAGSTKYVMVALGFLTYVLFTSAWIMISPLAAEVMAQIHIGLPQFLSLVSAPTLAVVIFGLVGGGVSDRIGVKWAMVLSTILMGLAGLLRVEIHSYFPMLVDYVVYGAGVGLGWTNIPHIVMGWFPPERSGLPTGILTAGANVGFMLGLAGTIPLFGTNLTAGYVVYGVVTLTVALAWVLFGQDAPHLNRARAARVEGKSGAQFLEGLRIAIQSRNLWLVSVAYGLNLGALLFVMGDFPTTLATVDRVLPAVAGLVTAVFLAGVVIGNFGYAAMADLTKRRKPLLIVAYGAAGILSLLLVVMRYQTISTPIVIGLLGLMQGADSLMLATPMALREIPPEHKGIAQGLMVSIGNIITFVFPIALGNIVIGAGLIPAYAVNGALLWVVALLMALTAVEIGVRLSEPRVESA